VDSLVGRQFGLHRVQEPDELLMPMSLHVASDKALEFYRQSL
jgi:hypothetical protein